MNNYFISEISEIAIHHVGNKLNNDGVSFSKMSTDFDKKLKDILINYFITPFKSNEYYNFYHNSDRNLNEVFVYVSAIFSDSNSLFVQSRNIVKHLYDCSTHPRIKSGEFYTVFFKDCVLEGETVDAIGLFKSENRDIFLKVKPTEQQYQIESNEGININKLDKGCLIFNTNKDNGFVVSVVDSANKGDDAKYWVDNFLQLAPREDDYHNTQNVLTLCKKFITNELPEQFELSKADQANLLNKSIQFFRDKDAFDMEAFTHEVIENPQMIEQFNNYKSEYQNNLPNSISDNFTISSTALKKQVRVFKSVLKLDKNFQVYIHGNREMIEKGIDADGRKYYKLYYQDEN